MFCEGPRKCIPKPHRPPRRELRHRRLRELRNHFQSWSLVITKYYWRQSNQWYQRMGLATWLDQTLWPKQGAIDDPIRFSMLNQTKPANSRKIQCHGGHGHVFPYQALPSPGTPGLHRFHPLSCSGPPQPHNLPQRGQKAAGGDCLHEPPAECHKKRRRMVTGNPESHGFYMVLRYITCSYKSGNIGIGLNLVPKNGDCNWQYLQMT